MIKMIIFISTEIDPKALFQAISEIGAWGQLEVCETKYAEGYSQRGASEMSADGCITKDKTTIVYRENGEIKELSEKFDTNSVHDLKQYLMVVREFNKMLYEQYNASRR